jgi:hypothetical protein
MPNADIITPHARKVLDILGNGAHILQWKPVPDNPCHFIVVWTDETASLIQVLETVDPGPAEYDA